MACTETQKLIAEYLGGEMTAAQRAACEYHFSQCSDCRQTLGNLVGATDQLLAWESIDVPEWDRSATMMAPPEVNESDQVKPQVVAFPGNKTTARDKGSRRKSYISGRWQSWLPLAATVALAMFLGWNQEDGLSEQELTAYLDAYEQRQQAQTQLLLDTALQEFGDSTSDSMIQLVEWIEAQRAADMQQLEASFQQMLSNDYRALNSMQQLASWASTQEP